MPYYRTMAPWWMSASPYYSNFYGPPGFYNGWGMMPNYFPTPLYTPPYVPPHSHHGGGGMYAAKPVLYIKGPAKSKVRVIVETGGRKDSNVEVLVAVPAFSESKGVSSWSGELTKTGLKTPEGEYPYFFYDAWIDDAIFQDRQGHCGDRKEVLGYMQSGLKQRGFPEESIQEFEKTWSVKLPFNQNLCVYPQTEREMQKGVKISFEPKTVELVQLEYVVVPKQFFASEEAKGRPRFTKEPKEDFQFASRKVASASTIRAYDWGVGFMRLNPKK